MKSEERTQHIYLSVCVPCMYYIRALADKPYGMWMDAGWLAACYLARKK